MFFNKSRNGMEGGNSTKSHNEQAIKSNNNYILSQLNNSFSNYDCPGYGKNLNNPKENLQGFQKCQGEKQFHPSTYSNDIDLEVINNINQKNKLLSQAGNSSGNNINANQLISNDVFNDPAFLKRPRGRPKGSKCKYTDDEKLQILKEVRKSKSVQVIAEKYRIQNSLIRYWARQLNYELDPQAVSSRRPYRIFSRDQKNVIIQEAIKKRDIVQVAQEYDVNAQVLKRWILKGAQGLLQTQEMRQMMNAVPNTIDYGEDDNSQSQDDSDMHSDEDDEYDDDDEEENGDQHNDDEQQGQNISNQDIRQQNNSNQYKQNNKYQSQKLAQIQNQGESVNNFTDIFGKNGIDLNQEISKMEAFLQEQMDQNDIIVKNEESNNQESNQKLEEKLNKKRKQIIDQNEDDESNDDSEDENEDRQQSSQNVTSKKLKPNSDKVSDEYSENENQNKNNSKSSISNKNKQNSLDSNIADILSLDLLKKIDLKNLDLSANTLLQSEELNIMQKKLQEELMKMKQQQQEKIIQKQITEKKKLNIINPKTQQQ